MLIEIDIYRYLFMIYFIFNMIVLLIMCAVWMLTLKFFGIDTLRKQFEPIENRYVRFFSIGVSIVFCLPVFLIGLSLDKLIGSGVFNGSSD